MNAWIASCALVIVAGAACSPIDRNDVYARVPRGTALSSSVLRSAEQMCLYEDELITLFDQARPIDDAYDPHLMFWGRDRKLYAASYFASEQIERVDAGVIYGLLNEHRAQRVSVFRGDLPKKYRLSLMPDNVRSVGEVSDTVIDALAISPDGQIVTLETRQSQGSGTYPPDTASNIDGSRRATLRIPLCGLHWNYRERFVSTRETVNRARTHQRMRIADPKLLDEFYERLMKTCAGQACSPP